MAWSRFSLLANDSGMMAIRAPATAMIAANLTEKLRRVQSPGKRGLPTTAGAGR